MFVSRDKNFDLQNDPELMISLSDDLVNQERQGIEAGETAEYDGSVDVIFPFGYCPFQPRYVHAQILY